MNANIVPIVAFLTALIAFFILPVSATAASIALSVTGMLSVFTADYGRSLEPIRVESPAPAAAVVHDAVAA